MSKERQDAQAAASGSDTNPSEALNDVRRHCEDVARGQGGTTITPISDHGKGNVDDTPFDHQREPVNSDPQGFKHYDVKRLDSNNEDNYSY